MSLTPTAPWPSFVINLEDEVRRREHMDRQLRAMGIAAEFVPAVNGSALSASDRAAYDEARAIRVYGVEMVDAELVSREQSDLADFASQTAADTPARKAETSASRAKAARIWT